MLKGCDHRPSQYGCPICKKDCKTRQGYHTHFLRCGAPETTSRIRILEEELAQLKTACQTPVVQIQNNIHVQQVINFNLRSGSQYDTSHVTPEKVRAIIDRFRPDHLPQAGSQLLQLLFSNPVNRNILKRSLYNKVCDVFMEKEWRVMAEEDPMKVLTYDVFGVALDTYEQNDPYSERHAEILNRIVSEEEPYEAKARESIRAAVYDFTRKHLSPRTSVGIADSCERL